MTYQWRQMKKPDCDSCSYRGTHFTGTFNESELGKKMTEEAPREEICRNLGFYLNRVPGMLGVGYTPKEVGIRIERKEGNKGCTLSSETYVRKFFRTVKPSELNVISKAIEAS